MKTFKKIIILLIIIINVPINLLAFNYNKMDLMPKIDDFNTMFSVGFAFEYSEYNSFFLDGVRSASPSDNINITFFNNNILMAPYIEYRPLSFLEIGLSTAFGYQEEDTYNLLLNEEFVSSDWFFDNVNTYVKIALIDWFLSFALRADMQIKFSNDFIEYSSFEEQFNFSLKAMFAIVPKKIPFNFFFNYEQSFNENLINFGLFQAGFEFITSPFINVYAGINYMFEYSPKLEQFSLEVFTKFTVSFDHFVSGGVGYAKNVYGNNVGNDSTFFIYVNYNFL